MLSPPLIDGEEEEADNNNFNFDPNLNYPLSLNPLAPDLKATAQFSTRPLTTLAILAVIRAPL